MGEANKRGTEEQRRAAAKPRRRFYRVDARSEVLNTMRSHMGMFAGVNGADHAEKVVRDYVQHLDKCLAEPRRSTLLRLLKEHHEKHGINIIES